MPVKFTALQCHDDRPALDVETSIKRALGFSGVHVFEALTWLVDDFSSDDTSMVSDVDLTDPEGYWGTSGGVLIGEPIDGSQWYKVLFADSVELGFTVEFDKTGNEGAFLFMCGSTYEGYAAWWTGTDVGVSIISGSTESVLMSLPCTETGASHVRIAVYPRMYSNIDQIDDVAVSMWFDDRMLFTYMISYEEIILRDEAVDRKLIGFGVRNTFATFENVEVPQLHQVREWTSVDPGETAAASIGRTVGQDNIRVQARYDGSVKVWRNTGSTADWAVPLGRPISASKTHDSYPPSHLRLVGALHEADVFRTNLSQGHVFAIGQDPNAIMEEETGDKGERRHREIEEEADTLTLICAPNVALESGDCLSYDGIMWRVDNISLKIVMQSTGAGTVPVLGSTVTCRRALS